jgi:hypothetical protein
VRSGTRKKRWIDPLVALILICTWFIWSGALAGVLESETALSSSTKDAESGKLEVEGEVKIVRARLRPPEPSSAAAVATAPKQKPVTYQASTLLASVAPKSHPSRFSVRRLQ